uniref:Expansin-like EG45 domain-containing protein n=1 Tax=Hyaloperonospora arabidopsidis (strain Emoy2) TaxID=559515 RepID=M4BG12_HYAAE
MVRPFLLAVATALFPAVVYPVGNVATGIVSYDGTGSAKGLGQAAVGACNSNIGDDYAVVNPLQWNVTDTCNTCVQVFCNDARCASTGPVVLHAVDKSPDCLENGLDMSSEALKKLTGSNEAASFTIRWEFVTCPTTTDKSKPETPYKAGNVEPAKGSTKAVSILQETDKNVDKTSNHQLVVTKVESTDDARSFGTSPFFVVFAVLVAVCAFALVMVLLTVIRKKRRGKHSVCTTRSFDTFNSPANTKSSIVKF